MISLDLLGIIVVMSVLFLRHSVVYRDHNKINYAPVVLGLGVVGSVLHFIVYADPGTEMTIIKESLLALGTGAALSAVMGVMSRSASAAHEHQTRITMAELADGFGSFRHSVATFEQRLEIVAQMERSTHEQLREIFKEEIEALNVIQGNQKLFVSKIESLLAQQHSAMEKFEEFTLTELPGLDNVVHRHIDLLRIAEQDHFNQLKNALHLHSDENRQLTASLGEMHDQLSRIESQRLGDQTMGILHQELGRIVQEFERQMQTIGAKSETMVTTMMENDAVLKGSREQSELIMQQMVLSSKQMREITSQSKELADSLKPLVGLFASAEALHREFIGAKGKLGELIVTLEAYERHEARAVRENLERVAAEAIAQMQMLARSLEHYPEAPIVTKNIQELAGRVKLHKSYVGENQA